MPLDGHAYLLSQGWSGKGSGLRNGAISRPLAIPPKRTLSGLGRDRDEAFPFWDHVFTVAAKTIQVRIHNDESDSESGDAERTEPSLPLPTLSRTSTGLLSNKRPTVGTSASVSGSATPNSEGSRPECLRPRLSLIAAAKREVARKSLYACFFRGPVLGPDFRMDTEEPKCDCDEKIIASTSTSAMCHSVVQAEKRDSSVLVGRDDLIQSVEIGSMSRDSKQSGKGKKLHKDRLCLSEGGVKKKKERKDKEENLSKDRSKHAREKRKEKTNGNQAGNFSTTDRSTASEERKDKSKRRQKRSEEASRDDLADENSCNSKRKKRRKHASITGAMRTKSTTAGEITDPDRLSRSERHGGKREERRRKVEKRKKKDRA